MKANQIAMQAITGTDSAEGKGYSERIEIEQHIENLIKEYAKQKCKEQRELCQEEFGKGNPKVRHAPEPKFD